MSELDGTTPKPNKALQLTPRRAAELYRSAAEGIAVVMFPPNDAADAPGWVRGLLTDLAGWPDSAAELLEAVRDVQAGHIPEWSMQYNVYGVEVQPGGARVTFGWSDPDACSVPLGVLAAVVGEHLRL